MLRRVVALCLASVLALPPGGLAHAKPPAPVRSVDPEVLEVCKRAEVLLNKLEYERARELLEAAVRNPGYRKATAPTKGRLWALLGRARAEVGDTVGADEAFLQAVMWDRRVRLARGTSPKILEALERARANAPAPGEIPEPPAEERPGRAERPTRPDAGAAEDAAPAREPPAADAGQEARKPDAGQESRRPDAGQESRKPDAGQESRRPDAGAPERQREERPRPRPELPPPQPERPRPEPPRPGPLLRHRIEGPLELGQTVSVVLLAEGLPKGTKLELYARKAAQEKFKLEPLTRTGTVSLRKLKLSSPRVELYARALKGKKTLAALGSPTDPLVLTPREAPRAEPPPPLREAWSTPDIRPSLVPSSTTASVAVAKARTTTVSLPPPPPPPTRVAPAQDDTLLIVGLVVGGVVVAAGAVVLILVASSGGGCEAREGFGCTEVQVLPLLSF